AGPVLGEDALPPYALARLGSTQWRYFPAVRALTMLPDGHTLAVWGDDEGAILLDTRTGRPIGRRADAGGVDGASLVAAAPGGRFALLHRGNKRPYTVLDLTTGQVVREFKREDSDHTPALAASGRVAAFSSKGQVQVLDLETMKTLRNVRSGDSV